MHSQGHFQDCTEAPTASKELKAYYVICASVSICISPSPTLACLGFCVTACTLRMWDQGGRETNPMTTRFRKCEAWVRVSQPAAVGLTHSSTLHPGDASLFKPVPGYQVLVAPWRQMGAEQQMEFFPSRKQPEESSMGGIRDNSLG